MPEHFRFTGCMLFRYMKRRCHFLDNCPGFNFNNGIGEMVAGRKTNTKELGSILMRTMLSEVHNFCDPLVKFDWSRKAHQQVSPGFLSAITMPGPLWLLYYVFEKGWASL